MKILITGATGDVGRSLVSFLKKDYEVIGLARKNIGENCIRGNLENYDSLVTATEKIGAVIHLAALIKGQKKDLEKVNVNGTKNLIKACKENNVRKIIFISSLDVKFDLEYGKSKLKAEKEIQNSKLNYVILRPSLIYGKNFNKGINSLIKIIKNFLIIPIIGNGKKLYQPLYVEDLNNLIKNILDKNKFENKEYFVCGKERISMNNLVNLICKRLNKKRIKIHVPIFIIKMFKFFGFDYNNFIFDKTESNEKIRKDFRFEPIGINEGIKKLI